MAESVFESLYQEEIYLVRPRTLVLLDKPWNDISDEERTLLTKILGSVKLSLSSVQVLHRESADVNDLSALNTERVIAFGTRLSPVHKQYEYVPVDGYHVIVSDSLSALDDARKKNLWLALRQMFGI